jgi:hypothetical protein
MISKRLRVISKQEAEQFIEEGYVIIREAFSRNTAAQLANEVWEIIPENPLDPSTWTRPAVEIQRVIKSPTAQEIFTKRYTDSVNELVGEGLWKTNMDSFGWIPIRFPGFASPSSFPPASGWHVDGMNFNHRLTSGEVALAGMELYTDIERNGGGTVLRIGSHKYIGNIISEHSAQGISYEELYRISNEASHFEAKEAYGSAGDVLWMHPFLIHARGPNLRNTPRIAANRTISLFSDVNLSMPSHTSLLHRSLRQMSGTGPDIL